MRVALAQLNPTVGDLSGNSALIVEAVREAAANQADLVLCPEMVLTGYPIEDLALRQSFRQASAQAMQQLASELAHVGAGALTVIAGGLGTAADGWPTNLAAVLQDGQIQATYIKHRLPNYGVFDEYRLFKPGSQPLVVNVGNCRVGLAICEDIWDSTDRLGPLSQLLATPGGRPVDLLAVLNGSPFELGKTGQRRRCATAAAQLLDAPVLYANLVGGQDDLVFDGQSFIIDQNGQLLASAAGFQPDLLYCQIGEQDTSTPPLTATPTAGDTTTDTADAYQAAVLGLADYARKNGFRSAILGLSGGIDSALVATIASDALGPSNVVGVAMPSRYSSDHSLDDAADLAARLGLVYRVEPIEQLVASFDQQLALTGLAAENIQARVRGMILMAISNLEGHLVLATGNKSELATGYSTIYGDAVGGFAPIKDLVKTRVWQLAKYRNQRAAQRGETEPIPPRSISKPPSAELRPGQRDEDSLPAYQLLDLVLGQYVEQGCSRSDLLAAGHGAEAVDLVLRLTDRAEWKRRQYPPGPKITALAFGRDRRLPITNRWVEP